MEPPTLFEWFNCPVGEHNLLAHPLPYTAFLDQSSLYYLSQVAGELVNKQNASIRRFAQTFVLACENGSRNAFYIHNDICCFFDIGQVRPRLSAETRPNCAWLQVASLPVAVPQPPPQQTEALQPKTPVKEAAPSPIPASPTFGDAGAPVCWLLQWIARC